MALKIESTAGVLAAQLRTEIIEGSLAAGTALRQEEISARYGVSRSPLREALRQLEAEGWIEYRPNRGAVVASVSAQDVRELYEVRRILEAGAIRLAIPKIDETLLRHARAVDAKLRRASLTSEIVATHYEFHTTIYGACGNARLIDAISRHYVRVQRLSNADARAKEVRRCSLTDHRELVEACAAKDVRRAERVTLAHLNHLEAVLVEGLA